MLKPLEQWYCDECGEIIEKAKDGYVLWDSDGHSRNFKIIHKSKCDTHAQPSSAALSDFLGPDGLTYLLTFLSLGPVMKNLGAAPHVEAADLDEFVDFMRRVQTPHYEMARRKFRDSNLLQDLHDANEIYPYRTEVLAHIAQSSGH